MRDINSIALLRYMRFLSSPTLTLEHLEQHGDLIALGRRESRRRRRPSRVHEVQDEQLPGGQSDDGTH